MGNISNENEKKYIYSINYLKIKLRLIKHYFVNRFLEKNKMKQVYLRFIICIYIKNNFFCKNILPFKNTIMFLV